MAAIDLAALPFIFSEGIYITRLEKQKAVDLKYEPGEKTVNLHPERILGSQTASALNAETTVNIVSGPFHTPLPNFNESPKIETAIASSQPNTPSGIGKSGFPGSTPSLTGLLSTPKIPALVKVVPTPTPLPQFETDSVAAISIHKPALESEGEFQKKVLIISNRHLLYNDYVFLLKVLEAVGLKMPDICLLNLERNNHYQFPEIIGNLKPVKILGFGLNQDELIPDAEKYQVLGFGKSKVIFSHSISEIPGNPDHRRNLWNALKGGFMD